MKIKDKLLRAHAAVVIDKAKGGGMLGEQIGQRAVAAITKGMDSDEWKAYMALFADSPDQLKRLTTTALDGNNAWMAHARAYMVSNAICAAATNTDTLNGLDAMDIDANFNGAPLDETPDPAVAALRPFKIPDPF